MFLFFFVFQKTGVEIACKVWHFVQIFKPYFLEKIRKQKNVVCCIFIQHARVLPSNYLAYLWYVKKDK